MAGTSWRNLWILILVSGLARLLWASSLDLGNDEAYHALFVSYLDWSYFDHPPMLAAVEAFGVAIAGGRVNATSLRLGFVLLFAGSTWLMARLTARLHGARAGFWAAFALNVTAYHTAAAGAFALPDGPLLFFWLLTLDRLCVALGLDADRKGSNWSWLLVGLSWGGALLSKYHAVFLPAGVLAYLLIEPRARGVLRERGPYLAALAGLVAFAPVVFWNARHDWASFAFQGSRAFDASGIKPLYFLGAILGPAVYLFPWIWLRLVGILARGGLRLCSNETPTGDRFLLAQTVAPLATFLVVACTRPVLPHWTLVGFLPLFPLLGRAWANASETSPARFRRRAVVLAALPLLVATGVAWQTRTGVLQRIGLLGTETDPTIDMAGWDEVATELGRRGLLDPGPRRPFLFTSDWYLSGQLAFATRKAGVPVLCYHAWDARSFAFWSRPEEWLGRDGILVAVNSRSTEPGRFDRWFSRIVPIDSFQVRRGGVPIRTIRIFRCEQQILAFPFDDLGRNIRPDVTVRR